jgi:ribonuclease J
MSLENPVPGNSNSQPAVSGKVRVVSLGGIGEIGLNSFILEYNDDIVLIDSGQMAPEFDMLGIDLVIPDFSCILERKDKIRGIVLTHGHEDHIGALPYLLSQIEVPVYGTRLTLGLVKVKLAEFHLDNAELIEISPRQILEIGPFTFVPFRVTHSMADSIGLAVETPVGNLIFSGDYKFEPNPLQGDYYDFHTVTSYAERKVLALFADSTNVERRGNAPSENEVRITLDRIFGESKRSLVVSTFASSIYRIQTILDLAAKHKRYIFVTGLNMVRNIQMAREMGYLNVDDGRFLELKDLEGTPPQKRLLLSTGSQGEPLSVMSRLALGDYKWLKMEKGDTVIISARIIPGNEKAILPMINNFSKRGAKVYYEWIENVHASGHAYREDMKHLIQLTKPHYLIPVHGENRHLNAHKSLAMEIGMPEDSIFILENGVPLEFDGMEGASLGERIASGRIFVDGRGVMDGGDVVIRDRLHLSQNGMLIAIVAIDVTTGNMITEPYIVTRGFVFADESEELLNEAKEIVLQVFNEFDTESKKDLGVMKTAFRTALKKFIKNKTSLFPMILPVVLEI